MKNAAVVAALGKSPGGGNNLMRKIFVVLCVVHVSVSFAVNSGEDEGSDGKREPVLVGNFSVTHLNDTQNGSEAVTGKNKSCECSLDREANEEEKHADKIEQILWDIFVDEAKASDDEDASEVAPETEDRYREGEDGDMEEKLENGDVKEDESLPPHSISKRSLVNEEELAGEERTGRRANPNDKRRNKGSSKKGSHGKKAAVPSRGHNRPRSKGKKTNNVAKYNEYMDVVLKRMNTMIKTKKMDPLMVNLFSGNQQQTQNQNNKNKNGDNSKNKNKNKKKKNNKDNKKKRKGAKSNRARLEELDEMEGRSVSSDSDSSATVELDNEHDGSIHTGVGGVFIRRVGEYENSEGDDDDEDHDGEEDDDAGEDSDGERSFREIRALIVNGSMKRSVNETEGVSPSPPSPTVETETESGKSDEEEARGFSSTPNSSEESPRKKSSSKSKNKKDKSKSKKEEKTSSNKKPKPVATKKRATRGVLKGLSSLKRSGNVDVVRQSDDVRIVRGKFTLGPVTLEIVPKVVKKSVNAEPEDEERSKKGKPKKDNDEAEPPKVTAIARELKGVIEVRLKKNSPTTIKRLRVFPPSAVNVKSSNKSKTTSKSSSSVPRYNRVTPVATHRLRQIASAVVRQTDVRRKSSSLEKTRH